MRLASVKEATFFVVVLVLWFFIPAAAQFTSATLGIDGLTCSSCSFGVEKSIRQLDFVSDVKTDLNAASATIFFKPKTEISIDELVKKVYQAGFSVRFTRAVYHFSIPKKMEGDTFMIGKQVFLFLENAPAEMKGDVTLQLIGEKFSSKKVYKQWEPLMAKARIDHPLLQPDTYFILL